MAEDRYPPTKEHPEGKLKTPRPDPMPTQTLYGKPSRASRAFDALMLVLVLGILCMVFVYTAQMALGPL